MTRDYRIFERDDEHYDLGEKVKKLIENYPSTSQSVKFNAGKPPLTLVPNALTYGAAQAFAFGVTKYKKDNYRVTGLPLCDLADSVLRHVTEWKEGLEIDPESGLPVLSHAAAALGMLMDTVARVIAGKLPVALDDRFKEVAPCGK